MRNRLALFFRYAIFWLLFFVLARAIFILYNIAFISGLPLVETLLSFVYGFRMDLSFTGYIMIVAGAIFTFLSFASDRWIYLFLNPLMYLTLIAGIVIVTADCELYRNWGFRMDATPLLYLKTPKEAMASVSGWLTILLFLSACVYFTFEVWKFRKLTRRNKLQSGPGWKGIPVFAFLAVFMILPIRGSVGIAPMHVGTVYFSRHPFVNHAAVNVMWNVAYSLTKMDSQNRSVQFMSDKKADSLFTAMMLPSKDTFKVFKTERPNVIILILESFTSKIINASFQGKEITPQFNQLIHEGIYFSRFYASGDRSDKGIVTILSGYPAQPASSIIKFPQKTQKLPFLSKDIKTLGYNTAFYYGGDINFANMKSYFINGEFDRIVTKDEFDPKDYNSKWGVHDHVVFNRLIEDMKHQDQPFLNVYFTLSSHEPFEVPMKPLLQGSDEETRFLNSAHYTDSCIGNFVEQLKKNNLWENTLVILVADHGHRYPGNTPLNVSLKFHTPMLWIGGVLTVRDKQLEEVGSQTDIAPTLEAQLNLDGSAYIFGRNLLGHDSKGHAFFCFNNGFGLVKENCETVFDNNSSRFIFQSGSDTANCGMESKAFFQKMSEDFNSK